MILLKNKKEIESIKKSGSILSAVLRAISSKIAVGINLLELESLALKMIRELGGEPAFLGYRPEGAQKGFPSPLCVSLNDVVVHGIPFDHNLKSGDVLKIDMGVVFEGFYSDSAVTVPVGNVGAKVRKLISSTKRALCEAIKASRSGKTIGDIGFAIEKVAKKDGFCVLRGLTGHGVGFEVHEDPIVFNYGKKGAGMELRPGMVLAIEPMFSLSSEDIIQNKDESYSSYDRSMTAHFEHTIAIREKGGAEILTL